VSQRDVVQEIILGALERLNAELPAGNRVPVGPGTKLLGENSELDSLSLVSVIVDVEAGLEDKFDRSVSLTDDRAMSQRESPFTDVNALTNYVLSLLADKA
jgi:acyl carrier protein